MMAATDQPDIVLTSTVPPASGPGNSVTSSGRFFERIDWLGFGVTSAAALVVYLCTLAPEVTLEFSGILSASAQYAGVAHPPGFPVWTLYSWFFVKVLPFSNVAWRVAVGSAVAAALACGLVALAVSRVGTILLETMPRFTNRKPKEQNLIRLVCGTVAGMALGLSSTVWRVAVVAEVWALSVLLFAGTLCLLLRWMARPERRRFLYAASFVFALLLTSNQELAAAIPALVLSVLLADQELGRDLSVPIGFSVVATWALHRFGLFPWLNSTCIGNQWLAAAFLTVGGAGVVAIARTRMFGFEWRPAMFCGLMLLLGLGFYFYLPLASLTNPPMNWGYARTVEGFFHVITRGQYEPYHPTDNLSTFLGQLWILAKETWKGFGWPYLLFAFVPFGLLTQRRRSGWKWLLALAAVFVCVGPVMLALLNPSPDRGSVDVIRPFFAAMYVVLVLWIGLSLMVCANIVGKPSSSRPNHE